MYRSVTFMVVMLLVLPAFQHTTWLAAAALAPAQKQCGVDSEGISADGWQHDRIIDITVPIAKGLPVFDSPSGLPRNWRTLAARIEDGDGFQGSDVHLGAHTGTHVDAPAHFLQGGSGIESLDLTALIGPALVVAVPEGNITEQVLKDLHIPEHVERVIFRTQNTDKRLMFNSAFDSSYCAFDTSAASWLTEQSNIRLVGIDYLSIAKYEDISQPHKLLFKKGVVVVEGLDLSQVQPGMYQLVCLPPKYTGSDGAPVRCVLLNGPAAEAAKDRSGSSTS